ncbi:MAG: hypothetical protein JXM74_05520 [Fusobacteriaceae bacterium]|nr:hypothetical protein [Fusobacteriaceae bacterium]MBN2838197.1 hypothetical protein [Fusobacteriaceae bacterium]
MYIEGDKKFGEEIKEYDMVVLFSGCLDGKLWGVATNSIKTKGLYLSSYV